MPRWSNAVDVVLRHGGDGDAVDVGLDVLDVHRAPPCHPPRLYLRRSQSLVAECT